MPDGQDGSSYRDDSDSSYSSSSIWSTPTKSDKNTTSSPASGGATPAFAPQVGYSDRAAATAALATATTAVPSSSSQLPKPAASVHSSKIPAKIEKADLSAVKEAQGGGRVRFPWKLHQLLQECEESSNNNAIAWLPCGTAFRVLDRKVFTEQVMPRFFHSNKYKTFQRSLNVWGFESVGQGMDKGAVYHRFFRRGRLDLCRQMIRHGVKDPMCPTAVAAANKRKVGIASNFSPKHEMMMTERSERSSRSVASSSQIQKNGDCALPPALSSRVTETCATNSMQPSKSCPLSNAPMQRDYLPIAYTMSQASPSSLELIAQAAEEKTKLAMTTTASEPSSFFADRLYTVLDDPSIDCVGWRPHGRCFEIVDPVEFEQHVLHRFFDMGLMREFESELGLHGIYRIQNGRDAGCYYHDLLIRGLPHLCRRMKSRKEATKYLPDPAEIERFDFYSDQDDECGSTNIQNTDETHVSSPSSPPLPSPTSSLDVLPSFVPSVMQPQTQNPLEVLVRALVTQQLGAVQPPPPPPQQLNVIALLQQIGQSANASQQQQSQERQQPPSSLASLVQLLQQYQHQQQQQQNPLLAFLQQLQQQSSSSSQFTTPKL